MSFDDVATWWSFLCVVAALNVTAWALSVAALRRRLVAMPDSCYWACRRQLVLSAVYVFGCAFRSAVPVFDVPRLALFNTWLSSVVVGRTVATIAEVAFVAQWALMLRATARVTDCTTAKNVSHVIVPMILVAEVCSWYSVLTTSNLGHVIEESLWGLSAALLVVSMVVMAPRCPSSWRPAIIAGCAAAMCYVAYMFLVDVPMYWSRWLADEAGGRQYLSIAEGMFDVTYRRVVSHRLEDWQSEMVWMTLYFSVAVWISISLVHAAVRGVHRAR
jgi:hypothetical protein